jgi:integrase
MTELLLPALSSDLTPIILTADGAVASTPTPPHLSADEVDEIRANVEGSDAENTKRAYASAWRMFCAWCESRGATPLPALPETLAAYLSIARREDGGMYTVGSLNLHLSAIKRAHRERGLIAPTEHPLVFRVWKGIRRRRGTHQEGATALTADLLAKALLGLPDDVRGIRDRALLAVGFAGAFRRSELTALRLCDIGVHAQGIRLSTERRKTGSDEVYVDLAGGSLAAEALLAWLDALAASDAAMSLNPCRLEDVPTSWTGVALWRRVQGKKRPTVTSDGFSASSVSLVVKRATASIGLDSTNFSSHSLRSGFATTAAEEGQSAMEIRDAGGWKSVVTVDRYVQHRRDFGAASPRAKVLDALRREIDAL